jgi:Ribbon-helix-helix protein, copG family
MPERITVRLDDEVYSRLSDAAKARGMDVSAVVRQAVMAHLEGASGTAPTSVPPHTPEDCLAVVVSHASPVAQRRLAEAFARLDRIRTRLWLVAETLALWAARVEPRVHGADE